MTIRRATPDDFLAIAELDRRAWDNLENPEVLADGEHTWRIWVEHCPCWVAVEGDQVQGVLLAFPTEKEGYHCLHKIFVDPNTRGQGIGKQLFEAFLTYCSEFSLSAFLTVAPFNENAITLYEKMGFAKADYVEGFYRPEEHRWVMVYESR